ncbi:STAS domain-containing protein [Kineosporia sp. A_224]|uniref:STAS domain-containing protein n=1 Tax=Kineosporia sp. A_224 TaxID=1962180 RepID=UPI000B4B15B0|nr:STAS domain-containing protein [Kineosporia sp. A_224]
MDGVTVTRIGTQVVVRLSGAVDESRRERLSAAVDEVSRLALQRVVVDLDDVTSVEGAGIDFIVTLHTRWRVRLLNTPASVRDRLPRQGRSAAAAGAAAGPAADAADDLA